MTARRPARRPSTARWLACASLLALASPVVRAKDEPAPARSAPTVPAERSLPAPVQSLDDLRERLSQRIGNTTAVDRKNVVVMQVTKPAANDLQVSAHKATVPPGNAIKAPAARTARPANAPRTAASAASAASAPGDICVTGQRQSPIDIRDGIAVDLEPVQFDYRASSFSVIDTGHTVQVDVSPGNAIQVLGRRYELLQFHFHRPSEERIGGRQFDMAAHLVHQDAEGRQAIVAVLLEAGSVQPIVQTVWNNLPLEKHEAQPARVTLDPTALLPKDRRYYTYMGSLTSPPCTEGVLWMVMQQPVPIAPGQIDIFARLHPMNARPVQATAGRLIKQSN